MHGRRFRPEHRHAGNRLVTADWPGVDPDWSRDIDVASTSAADESGTVRRWHLLDNGAPARPPRPDSRRHAAVRARQPDLVLPVADPAGRRFRPRASVACGGGGPAGYGLLRAHRHVPAPGGPDQRPGRPHRRTRPGRAGGHRRPRLGRRDQPRLGLGTSSAARRGGADQHRRPPARRLTHPAGPAAGAAPCRAPLGNHDVGHLPAGDAFPGPPAAGRGCPQRLHGPLPERRPPRRRGELCRRHSRRPVPSQLPGAQPRRRRAARAESSGPDALGPAGPDLLRPVPQGPHQPAAARESPPLRGRRPPGRGRPGHCHPGLRVACRARPGQRARGRPGTGTPPTPEPGTGLPPLVGSAHRAGGRTCRRGHRRRGDGRRTAASPARSAGRSWNGISPPSRPV